MLCLLYLRAYESRLDQPILGDRYAADDVARIDYDFKRIHRRVRPESNQFMVALRATKFDVRVADYLKEHPDAVVLHLGCGLNSRAFRLAPPAKVRWFDVDLPDIIALRRQLYSESDTYRMIGSSVTDLGWLDDIPTGGPVVIVAEGLLMYLAPDDIAELLHRLVDRFESGELVADLVSRWGPRLSKLFARGVIKWGTRDGSEITHWEPRLHLVEDIPVLAGYDEIPLPRQRRRFRRLHGIPAIRNYDRLFRYTF